MLESVRTLLPDFATSIDAWISLRARERVEAIRLAAEDAGDLLVDATAAVVVTNASALSREAALAQATESILESLRQAEAQTRTLICRRFGFEGKAAEATALDVAEALGGVDLLSQASLERAGLWAAGAGTGLLAAGAMVDLVLGGITLGGFTALGAVGAALGAVGASGSKIVRRLRGQDEARLGNTALELLAKRQAATITGLLARGHAAIEPLDVDQAVLNGLRSFDATEIVRRLRKARDRGSWSAFSKPQGSAAGLTAPARVALMSEIGEILARDLVPAN